MESHSEIQPRSFHGGGLVDESMGVRFKTTANEFALCKTSIKHSNVTSIRQWLGEFETSRLQNYHAQV